MKIRFSSDDSFFSVLVKSISNFKYSHVDITDDGIQYTVKPFMKSRIEKFYNYKNEEYLELSDYLNNVEIERFKKFLDNNLNKPYDYLAVILIGLEYICRFFKVLEIFTFLFDRNWQNDKRWYCSEQIAKGILTSLELENRKSKYFLLKSSIFRNTVSIESLYDELIKNKL